MCATNAAKFSSAVFATCRDPSDKGDKGRKPDAPRAPPRDSVLLFNSLPGMKRKRSKILVHPLSVHCLPTIHGNVIRTICEIEIECE